MTKLVVPLDGSLEAELALPHARALAGDEPVVLVTAVWDGEPVAPDQYLEERATRLVGQPLETQVVVDQRPADAIAEIAASQAPALVCMATHGRNALSQVVLGSTAEAVMRTTTEPVLLVGPKSTYERVRADARNLVVAVDDADTASAIVPAAAAFARRHGLALWTIEAVPPAPYPFVADADIPSKIEHGPGLEAAITAFSAEGLTTETKLLIATDPADAIVSFARELPASFVVVGNHARHGVARLALGSTAIRVVHHCPCPVLVVRQ